MQMKKNMYYKKHIDKKLHLMMQMKKNMYYKKHCT